MIKSIQTLQETIQKYEQCSQIANSYIETIFTSQELDKKYKSITFNKKWILSNWSKLGVPPPAFLNWAMPIGEVGLVLVPLIQLFVLLGCLSFHHPPGLCLSRLFLWFCSIHGVGLFVHGNTFLHSWSGPMTLVYSRPATWSYVPVQWCSCSHRVFCRTLVVGKDTY